MRIENCLHKTNPLCEELTLHFVGYNEMEIRVNFCDWIHCNQWAPSNKSWKQKIRIDKTSFQLVGRFIERYQVITSSETKAFHRHPLKKFVLKRIEIRFYFASIILDFRWWTICLNRQIAWTDRSLCIFYKFLTNSKHMIWLFLTMLRFRWAGQVGLEEKFLLLL